jgi:hypothetical protein
MMNAQPQKCATTGHHSFTVERQTGEETHAAARTDGTHHNTVAKHAGKRLGQRQAQRTALKPPTKQNANNKEFSCLWRFGQARGGVFRHEIVPAHCVTWSRRFSPIAILRPLLHSNHNAHSARICLLLCCGALETSGFDKDFSRPSARSACHESGLLRLRRLLKSNRNTRPLFGVVALWSSKQGWNLAQHGRKAQRDTAAPRQTRPTPRNQPTQKKQKLRCCGATEEIATSLRRSPKGQSVVWHDPE